jgi:membrane associated rhomboid family serine protease
MIPISDDNPTTITPVMTWLIIAACVAVFFWELSLGGAMDRALFELGFTPAALFHARSVREGVAHYSAYKTIFISMFLHGGILHIAGNMLYLWIFGNNVEDAMGHFRFTLFYFICGIAAALTFAFMEPNSQIPMVGASGAISGILAAYFLLYPSARVRVLVPLGIVLYPMTVSAIWVIGFWFVMQLLSATLTDASQPGTAWWAHVGGFGAGLLLTPILKSRDFPLFGKPRRGPWG